MRQFAQILTITAVVSGLLAGSAAAQLRLTGGVETFYRESDAQTCPPGGGGCIPRPTEVFVATAARLGFEAEHHFAQDRRVYAEGLLTGIGFTNGQPVRWTFLEEMKLGIEAGGFFVEAGRVGDNRGAQILPQSLYELSDHWPSHPLEDFFIIEDQRLSMGLEFDDWSAAVLSDDDGRWMLSGQVWIEDAGWLYEDLDLGVSLGDDFAAVSLEWLDETGSLFANYVTSEAVSVEALGSVGGAHQGTIGFRQSFGHLDLVGTYAKLFYRPTTGANYWFNILRGGLQYELAPGLKLTAAADKQYHSEPDGKFEFEVHNYHLGVWVGF